MNGTLITSGEALALEYATRLAQVTQANGYETDLGVKVYHGLRKIDTRMVPCVVIAEGPDDVSRKPIKTSYNVTSPCAFLAYVPCDAENPNLAAHAAIRDIKRAIFKTNGQSDFRLGGRVIEVEYLGRDIGPRGDGQAFVCAAVEVSARYGEDVSNP